MQRAHADSVRAARFARLQTTVYLLLAGAEVDADGALVMPLAFPEPRLSLPDSGLYASIVNVARDETWRSAVDASASSRPLLREVGTGQWRYEVVRANGRDYLAVGTGVSWAGSARRGAAGAVGVRGQGGFRSRDRRLRAHGVGLARRRRAAAAAVADRAAALGPGAAARGDARDPRASSSASRRPCEGRYPVEVAALTDNLNTLIAQERLRQTRYREALSFLAHSLKTPLAVLRTALGEPAQLPAAVAAQVTRMDDIVQHQLGRAAASGASRFAPPLALAPVLERIRDSLAKVYADKGLVFTLDCAADACLAHRRGRCLRAARQPDGQRGQVGAAAGRGEHPARGRRLHICASTTTARASATPSAMLQLHVRGDERVPGPRRWAWRWSTTWSPATTAS